jgi:hypothetical protein
MIYTENPEKTTNPEAITFEMDERTRQGLGDVIAYAANESKTTDDRPDARRYISAINCEVETARSDMLRVKREFDKEGGIIAYHGYQSFAAGEVTPEVAHEIGVKLARELWGADYQILVTTHLDKGHLHNHVVVNSVSLSGRRMWSKKSIYYRMRETSDRLCREYGLSVIENPKPGKSQQYAEWYAAKGGGQTWRGIVKHDIDRFIREATSEKRFFEIMRENGYAYKIGKDISVRPPGKERFVRLMRNFGDEYSLESIKGKIAAQELPARPPRRSQGKSHRSGSGVKRSRHRKIGGFRGLYIKYMYRLGILPRRSRGQNARMHFLLREDIRYMNRIIESYTFLSREKIETIGQLNAFRCKSQNEITRLTARRKELHDENRRAGVSDEARGHNTAEITQITARLKALRHELRLTDDIESRSRMMRDKLETVNTYEKQEREDKTHGRIHTGRRTGDKDHR